MTESTEQQATQRESLSRKIQLAEKSNNWLRQADNWLRQADKWLAESDNRLSQADNWLPQPDNCVGNIVVAFKYFLYW